MKIFSAEFVTSSVKPEQFPKDRKPQIAFAGRSNVGKSSLINALLHRKGLVKTSSTPGKTQTINFFLINNQFYFVDLPGYGYAQAPRAVTDAWAPMIEGYLKNNPELRAVVVLLDARREPDARDIRMQEWLRQYSIPEIYVLTKTDKLNRQEAVLAKKTIGPQLADIDMLIPTSAKNGQGMNELWGEIRKRLTQEA